MTVSLVGRMAMGFSIWLVPALVTHATWVTHTRSRVTPRGKQGRGGEQTV
jgi:hypothetical protein